MLNDGQPHQNLGWHERSVLHCTTHMGIKEGDCVDQSRGHPCTAAEGVGGTYGVIEIMYIGTILLPSYPTRRHDYAIISQPNGGHQHVRSLHDESRKASFEPGSNQRP